MQNSYPVNTEQDDKNYDLLRRSELGVLLTRAYLSAVNMSPRLADLALLEMPADSDKTASARPIWSARNISGRHEVRIRLDDLDGILEAYESALESRPAVVEHVGQMLGLQPEDMTPQLFYVFSMLHEMGHVDDYMEHEDNPEEFRRKKRMSEASLPLGRVSTTELLDPSTELHQKVMSNQDLFDRHGVSDIKELAAVNLIAYRNMRHEKYADEFATQVLLWQPALMDQLMRDTVEPYRNFDGFGTEAA